MLFTEMSLWIMTGSSVIVMAVVFYLALTKKYKIDVLFFYVPIIFLIGAGGLFNLYFGTLGEREKTDIVYMVKNNPKLVSFIKQLDSDGLNVRDYYMIENQYDKLKKQGEDNQINEVLKNTLEGNKS